MLDPSRAIYEAHPQNTILINQQATGMILYIKNMDPNVNIEQEIVFDVPEKEYVLLVTIPGEMGLVVNGKVTPLANYFIFDISSQILE